MQIMTIGLYDSCKNKIINIGRAIEERDNVPLIGKLTYFLPCAALAASLQNCPGQSLLLFATIALYILYKSDSLQSLIAINTEKPNVSNQDSSSIYEEDDFFIFEGDTLEDAEEQEDEEGQMLDESQNNIYRKKNNKIPPIKFL